MVSDYFNFVGTFGLSDWHITDSSASVPDPSMLTLIHFDVIRLGRFFTDLPATDQSLCRRMERVLYILGSVCSTTKYMQGFNELLAPIYFVLLRGNTLFENDAEIEAIAFHFLHSLVTQTRLSELFTTQDGSSLIIHRLRQFEGLLGRHLPAVATIVQNFRIHPMCYCFRWLSLLFAQEHPLEKLVLLWDKVFAKIDQMMDYMIYIGLGHLKQMECKLDKDNLSRTMAVLMNPSECDLEIAMKIAEEL
jgi:hypothetical protein